MSVREYAILWVGAIEAGSSGASGLGGAIALDSPAHDHDGPSHTGLLPIIRLSTTELDVSKVLTPDGAGSVTWSLSGVLGREVLMASGITDPPDPMVSSDGTDWLYGVAP